MQNNDSLVKEHTMVDLSDDSNSNKMNLLSLPEIISGEESDKEPAPTKTKKSRQ